MKRSFLHSLAIFFALGFLGGIFLIVTGNLIAGVIVALICMLMTSFLLTAADKAPERKSRLLRTAGWLAGIAIAVALVAVILAL